MLPPGDFSVCICKIVVVYINAHSFNSILRNLNQFMQTNRTKANHVMVVPAMAYLLSFLQFYGPFSYHNSPEHRCAN